MRKIAIIVCLFAAAVIFLPFSAAGAERRMALDYSVTVRVECLAEALEALRALPGHDLNASISGREAHFTRRVEAWAFRHTQEALRELGEVTNEHERATHLEASIAHTQTQVTVLTREIERLTVLMAAATSLHMLNAVDMQLTQVSHHRDWLIGSLNAMRAQAQHATLRITLTERAVPAEEEAAAFGTRMADSFIGSWNATLRFGGNAAVLLARISLPLAVWAAAAGTAAFFVLRRLYRKGKPAMGRKGAEVHE